MAGDWVSRLRRAALQGALLAATSSCGGTPVGADGGALSPLPESPSDASVNDYQRGLFPQCVGVPISRVCPDPGTAQAPTAVEGPYLRSDGGVDCCYFAFPYLGRPLRDGIDVRVAQLSPRTDWC